MHMGTYRDVNSTRLPIKYASSLSGPDWHTYRQRNHEATGQRGNRGRNASQQPTENLVLSAGGSRLSEEPILHVLHHLLHLGGLPCLSIVSAPLSPGKTVSNPAYIRISARTGIVTMITRKLLSACRQA